MCRGFCLILLGLPLPAATAYIDATHPSKVMGESRHYRLFPPPD